MAGPVTTSTSTALPRIERLIPMSFLSASISSPPCAFPCAPAAPLLLPISATASETHAAIQAADELKSKAPTTAAVPLPN